VDAPEFIRGGVVGALAADPASHIATHHTAFSATAFCKLQLILRCCGRRSKWLGWDFKRQPLVAPRSPPCKFFGGCNLLDFAELRKVELEAWRSLHLSLTFSKLLATNPASHNAAHHAAFFCNCILQAAIDFAEVRTRSFSNPP